MFGVSLLHTIFLLVWCTIPMLISTGICIYARASKYLILALIVMMCLYPIYLIFSVLFPDVSFWAVGISLFLPVFILAPCFWLGYEKYECEAIGRSRAWGILACILVGIFWWLLPLAPAILIARGSLTMRNMGWGKERVVRKEPEGAPPDWRDVRDEEAESD